jgi:hypothetical protein
LQRVKLWERLACGQKVLMREAKRELVWPRFSAISSGKAAFSPSPMVEVWESLESQITF